MGRREHDAHRLDVAAFAREGGSLEGHWPLTAFSRLALGAVAPAEAQVDDGVAWRVRGEWRALRAGAGEVWLHLEGHAAVWLQCQRCLQPVRCRLDVDRAFRFVADEDEAARLDAEIEEDVLVLTRNLDVAELIEDELLLALPLVPRHDACALPTGDGAEAVGAGGGGAFAALAALRQAKG